MKIFERQYSDEDLYDIERDVMESFDSNFNPVMKDIPVKDWFREGTFTVTITWSNDD